MTTKCALSVVYSQSSECSPALCVGVRIRQPCWLAHHPHAVSSPTSNVGSGAQPLLGNEKHSGQPKLLDLSREAGKCDSAPQPYQKRQETRAAHAVAVALVGLEIS